MYSGATETIEAWRMPSEEAKAHDEAQKEARRAGEALRREERAPSGTHKRAAAAAVVVAGTGCGCITAVRMPWLGGRTWLSTTIHFLTKAL